MTLAMHEHDGLLGGAKDSRENPVIPRETERFLP